MKYCLVNGKQQDYIDIENRGLAYGDGLFTTAKISNGHVQFLSAHIERLFVGCKKLGITPPSRDKLIKQLTAVAKTYSLAVLKVIITAKSGGRGYARATNKGHDLIITVHDYPSHYDELTNTGLNLGVSKQQIGLNPMLAGLKHLNRLEQVLLRDELSARSEDDLLVTNIHGEVIEATSANLFFTLNGILYTPNLSQSGVNGIMRQAVLKRYPDTIVKSVTLKEMAKVNAMFICNCVMGIMPVSHFNNRTLDIEQVKLIRDSMKKEASLHGEFT